MAKAKTELCNIREGRKLPPIEQKKADRLKETIEDAKNTIEGVWEACGNKVLDKGKNKGKQLKDVPSWSTTNGRYTNHVRPFFGSDFSVTQLDQEKVDAFKDSVLQLGLADQTKSHIIHILIKIIKKAGLNLELRNISVSSMTTEALSEEQERRLLAVADKSRPQKTRRTFYFFYHCRMQA